MPYGYVTSDHRRAKNGYRSCLASKAVPFQQNSFGGEGAPFVYLNASFVIGIASYRGSVVSKKMFIWSSLIGAGLFLGSTSRLSATETSEGQFSQFRRIEQPFGLKVLVTTGGLALIGAELWWFLIGKTQAQQAQTNQGVQEVAITVDGGYNPDRVVVQAGQPVRLNFFRKDPSSCLEQVLVPDFHKAADLQLNQTTPVEFTPQEPGTYTFHCGMNMFRGAIEVQSAAARSTSPQPDNRSHYPSEKSTEKTLIAQIHQGIQEMDIEVDRGYEPERIVVKAGLPVRLNFVRQDANSCLGKLLLPDFDIALDLPLHQVTSAEFTPKQPGEYEFTCGMKMFRGVVEVHA